ncbi:MAG: NAD-dependent epimerase/dehydratase family protein [Chiayiivirga sp.]|jgi:GDP-L-fucose synthase|nr:NAD-dependent epimerase/dehydratase family protein [Chiayiivirga sp.]
MIEANVIHAAWRPACRSCCSSARRASTRAWPAADQGGRPAHRPLEPTNEPYAIAKIAGLKLCQAYRKQYGFDAIVAMPTNLYGPGDNYDPEDSATWCRR